MRERRRTRTPGRIVKGRYALRLCCAGCSKYLFGDVGRYRHPPPTCEGFLAAKPVVRCRRARNRDGVDTRIKGHSYPQEWYEDAVGELLGKVGDLDDQAMTEVVRLYGEGLAKPDELTLARMATAQLRGLVTPPRHCRQCGVELEDRPGRGRPVVWCEAHRTAIGRRPAGRVCGGCGVSLDGRRRQTIVCGERYRSRLRRRRTPPPTRSAPPAARG
ncbi:MAG: hypothetical protein PVH07_12105 [Chloroflexota bacterium]